jgi:predicted AlkP superfamily phosphohydrolase/phosphomutase
MNAGRTKPLLVIALDAAEPSLVEKWMNDGRLPTLKRLRSEGAYGRLKSSAEWLAGSPWPTFYTGTGPAEHGLYETLQWRAERMQHAQASPEWLPLCPFWRNLGKEELRVVSIDLPMTYPPEPFDGIEIRGWMTQDSISNVGKPTSHPATEVDDVRDKFGLEPIPITSEKWGLQKVKSLLRMRDQLIQATQRMAKLARTLMTREKWDLFLVALAAPHRGGHKLWDLSGTYGSVRAGDREEFSHSLRDIYFACDRVVGQLAEAASDDARILVFSLHGMRANTNRTYLLPKILHRILDSKLEHSQESNEGHSSFLTRTKEHVPSVWRSIAFQSPPFSTAYKLYSFCCSKLYNIAPRTVNTPAFSLETDLNGYIRINLRGREKNGIVEPGEGYDQMCSALIKDLETFVDADTHEPVVEQVVRSDVLFKSGARLKYLPDLIVRWASSPSTNQRATVSNRYPSLIIPAPKRNLDGRSGNHSPEGFLLAVGSKIPHNSQIENGSILDLAPTICALLGAHKPAKMHGNSLWAVSKDI